MARSTKGSAARDPSRAVRRQRTDGRRRGRTAPERFGGVARGGAWPGERLAARCGRGARGERGAADRGEPEAAGSARGEGAGGKGGASSEGGDAEDGDFMVSGAMCTLWRLLLVSSVLVWYVDYGGGGWCAQGATHCAAVIV
eukprot:658333-Prymnesium_polylepis.1